MIDKLREAKKGKLTKEENAIKQVSACIKAWENNEPATLSTETMKTILKTLKEIKDFRDVGNVKTMSHIFDKCSKLSNDSLNNILKICANAVNSSTRTLKGIGITSQQANICKTLSNYQEFLDAGWTTGY